MLPLSFFAIWIAATRDFEYYNAAIIVIATVAGFYNLYRKVFIRQGTRFFTFSKEAWQDFGIFQFSILGVLA